MKTFKFFKYSSGIAALTLMATLAACGNNGSSNTVTTQPPLGFYGQCVNCQTIGGTFFQAESQDAYGILRMIWNFSGQTAVTPAYYGSPIVSYNGPVSNQGTLILAQPLTVGFNYNYGTSCQLPAGTYSVGTVGVGQWSSAIVSNLRMQVSGPVVAIISLTAGQVSAKTGSQLGSTWSEISPVGRIFGNLVVESINGYPCNASILVQ